MKRTRRHQEVIDLTWRVFGPGMPGQLFAYRASQFRGRDWRSFIGGILAEGEKEGAVKLLVKFGQSEDEVLMGVAERHPLTPPRLRDWLRTNPKRKRRPKSAKA